MTQQSTEWQKKSRKYIWKQTHIFTPRNTAVAMHNITAHTRLVSMSYLAALFAFSTSSLARLSSSSSSDTRAESRALAETTALSCSRKISCSDVSSSTWMMRSSFTMFNAFLQNATPFVTRDGTVTLWRLSCDYIAQIITRNNARITVIAKSTLRWSIWTLISLHDQTAHVLTARA